MPRIAITGGVGEGKSTVLKYMHDMGISTVSSDVVARHVFNSDLVQRQIAEFSGMPMPIKPEDLRDLFPQKPTLRRTLNRIMHPLIREELLSSKAAVAEVPLLIEACMVADFDRIWVVTCGPEEQLARVTERLGSVESARRLIATQIPTRAKLPFADVVIRTNQPEDCVKSYIAKVIRSELGYEVA
jgi:dephospho-CoA kinase